MVEKLTNVVLCKYGEVALRKGNRHLFEGKIITNLREILEVYGKYYVSREQGRLVIEKLDGILDFDFVISKVENVLGISYIAAAVRIKSKDFEEIKELSLHMFARAITENTKTFKVDTKRADKSFQQSSLEISAEIGSLILDEHSDLKVKLKKPDLTLTLEIRTNVYIYTDLQKGVGGLPVGTSGLAHILLSGGIDSPVAYYLMARRGVELKAVYFHSSPYVGEKTKEKVKDLAEILCKYTAKVNLYIVDFTETQLYLLDNVPHNKLTVFLKRAMIKISSKIAERDGGLALVMGDSVGQVASQTLQAINAVNSATQLPILRPLAGFDKQDIIDIAEKIGTFETSILPYEDCCTIFVPEKPDIKPKTSIIEAIEKDLLKLDELVETAVVTAESLWIQNKQ